MSTENPKGTVKERVSPDAAREMKSRRDLLKFAVAGAAGLAIPWASYAQDVGPNGSFYVRAYPQPDFTGASRLFTVSNPLMRWSEALGRRVGSVRVPNASQNDVLMFCFDAMPGKPQYPYLGWQQHGIAAGLPAMGDFNGRFMQITNRRNDHDNASVSISLPNYGWSGPGAYMGNRYVSSALALPARIRTEFRWHTGRVFPFVWNQVLKFVLSMIPVKIAADPVETLWLPFPEQAPGQMSSQRMYLVVHQGFKVDTVLRNVQCCLNAYLEVGVDDNGMFQLVLRHSDHYVWPGVHGHIVENQLAADGVKAAWNAVWEVATGLFRMLTNIPAEHAYLLPGSQDMLPNLDGVTFGHVNQDHATLCVLPSPGASNVTAPGTDFVLERLQSLVQRLAAFFGEISNQSFAININNGNGTQIVNSACGSFSDQIALLNAAAGS